jgi:hypothetical protein
MYIKAYFLLLLFSIFLSCNTTTNKVNTNNTIADSTAIIDIHAIIQNDRNEVLTTPYSIQQQTIVNKQKLLDTIITNKQFALLSAAFTNLPIQVKDVKKNYIETVFKDAATNSVAINYTTNKPGISIKNIDVLMTENGQTTKRIFIKQIATKNDTLITTTYSWKIKKSFQIITVKNYNNTIISNQQTTINWNDY